MATHSSILAQRTPMDREAWWGYSPWGHKHSDITEQLTHTHGFSRDINKCMYVWGAGAEI